MNTKMCRKCGETKSVDDFYKGLSKQDNRHPYCKECAKSGAKQAYKSLNQKEWMVEQARNSTIVLLRVGDEIKIKYGCAVCEESCPFCLEFHHIDPKIKDGAVSKLLHAKSIKKAIPEINKCVVLCANCHRKFHAGLAEFDISKQCNEDLNYWQKQYKKYKQNVIKKDREYTTTTYYCECGVIVSAKNVNCIKCAGLKQRRAQRPPLKQLQQEVKELGYCGTGRKYGISDNGIRKWLKSKE